MFDIKIVHTGQHFNKEMTDVFFQQLQLWPDYFLNIPQLSPNVQIAEVMLRLEKVLGEFMPDLVIVPGDVNSTLGAALCSHKCGYKLAHLESGLRSFDRSMPEEINRIITDSIADLFFVTEPDGVKNLLSEGKAKRDIHLVGNTMIDTLIAYDKEIRSHSILNELGIHPQTYALITMHRPATVDNPESLEQLCALLKNISIKIPIIFPMHPRTAKNLKANNLWVQLEHDNILITEALDYFAFQNLVLHARFVITDSGGIQEETTFRKIPCLTLRPNTERPVTVTEGSNTLIDFSLPNILTEIDKIMNGNYKTVKIPALWDGFATKRILDLLV